MEQFEPRVLLSTSPWHPDDPQPAAAAITVMADSQLDPPDSPTPVRIDLSIESSGSSGALTARQLVVVDPAVEGYEGLIDRLRGRPSQSGMEVLILDSDRDGIEQISEAILGGGYEAVHVLGHGARGELQVGGTVLNSDNLAEHAGLLSRWGESLLPGADVLLYGCNVADGEWGCRVCR